jgi:3D (Asp-Asp-Asp) domain-containing protein
MQFLIPVLVSLLVLPVSAVAPMSVAHAQTTPIVVTVPVPSILALTDTKSAPAPLTVKLTAYNAVPEQTDNNPFTTASGAFSNPEVVAARSGDLASKLPFGTVIQITRTFADTPSCGYNKVKSQIGYRVIADAMNARISNTVDVLLDQNQTVSLGSRELNPGIVLGVCSTVSVQVIGHMKISNIPDTQAELVALIVPPVLALR